MYPYIAPLRDIQFVIHELADSASICSLPAYRTAECDQILINAILEEAGVFAENVLSPLNAIGDREGASWLPGEHGKGEVRTAPGFPDAYRRFVEGGWMALPCDPEFGGQGLPQLLGTAVGEMWKGANLAFSHVITLTHGAIDALAIAGSDELKATYLPKLVSGEWTGTMNITEPQAGSDLAAITCRAQPQDGGTYRILGQKIFITYGDHDVASNIVHLVLARTPDAPAGTRGLSLFLVPKFIPDASGNPGTRNDVYCSSIEHKMGIHGSPTTTLVHGDHGGSVGYLIGQVGKGLEIMFIMMNSARLAVGTEALGVSQYAWQMASTYAKERLQGSDKHGGKVAIVHHPDVRRLLTTQRSITEALRALTYMIASQQDLARHAETAQERQRAHGRIELLTPILKGWGAESAVELASMAIQVFGGMGFVEETGIAQCLRDVRITPIYEGTTAIQAADLVGRKIARDDGNALNTLLNEIRSDQTAMATATDPTVRAIAHRLEQSLLDASTAANAVLQKMANNPASGLIIAEPFLRLMGTLAGGWLMGKSALIAAKALTNGTSDPFYIRKISTAKFYADHILPRTTGLAITVQSDNDLILMQENEAF
ncbi:Acyl-CoA dehydrogenase OS=Castellaniella sp OX=1955812 GN=EPN31_14410 PE=3 SV=1 [Castellaniella denitrificans]